MSKKVFLLAGALLVSNVFTPSLGRAFSIDPKFEVEPEQRQFLSALVYRDNREQNTYMARGLPYSKPRISKVPIEIVKASYDGKKIIRLDVEKGLSPTTAGNESPAIVWIFGDDAKSTAQLFSSIAFGETQEFTYVPKIANLLKVDGKTPDVAVHSIYRKGVYEEDETSSSAQYFFPESLLVPSSAAKLSADLLKRLDDVKKLRALANPGDVAELIR